MTKQEMFDQIVKDALVALNVNMCSLELLVAMSGGELLAEKATNIRKRTLAIIEEEFGIE